MSYLLTDEQKDLQAMVKDFAEKEVRPVIKEYDLNGTFPMEQFKKAAKMGLTSLMLAEEFGGMGASTFTNALICEELGKVDVGFNTCISACNLAAMPIKIAGTNEQIQKYADVVLNGGLCAFGLTEPASGSDAGSSRTIAKRVGDEYILNGRKCFITNGAVADLYVIFATMDRSMGTRGITAFLVEKGTPGLSAGKEEDKMGFRLSNTTDVILEDVRIPVSNRLGEEGKGFKLAMQTLDRTRPSSVASAIGLCQNAIDISVKYAKERITFGQPIATRQGIQFMIADMEINTQAARQLVWHAARLIDEGVYDGRLGSCAKTFASEAAFKVAADAVQILGGYGYMRDYPAEKLLRDAKLFQIFEGTNQIQRMVIGSGMVR